MATADRLQRQHDAASMRILLQSEQWTCFQRHLQAEIESAQARVNDVPLMDVEAARGELRGLLHAQQLPHRLIALAKEPD